MLCETTYSQAYIEACRDRVNTQVAAYQNLVKTANTDQTSVLASFEAQFFNNLVLMLDSLFCHRSRTMEKKDGNPLNEVRLICQSLLYNANRMGADKSMRLEPTNSILGYNVGDEIQLSQADFVRLANGFFAEIASKYQAAA